MALTKLIEIKDLSASARIGVTGKGAADWLQKHTIEVPHQANHWLSAYGQYVVLRLGNHSFLIEWLDQANSVMQGVVSALKKDSGHENGLYQVPRADGCFQIDGAQAAQLLSQLCRLDLSVVLEDNALAMTQIADIAAVIIKVTGEQHCYRIWFDISYKAYLLETITTLSKHINDSEIQFN